MALKSASLFFAALALALLCARSASAERIRIAYSAISGVQLPLWIAKESGFFKRQGLDVDFLYIGGGSVVVQAMLGGEVQLARASAPGIVQAALHGADLVMIANTVNTLVYSVMTRPDVKSPENLRGKTLGVTRLGGGTDYVVTLLLKKWNFQRGRDVKVFQTGGMPQLLSAVQTGVVDAGVISPPSNLQGLKLGLKELVDVSDLGLNFVNSPLNATRSYIKSNRGVVLRTLRAYVEGIRQVRSDKAAALRILAKYARIEDPEILQEVYRIYGVKHLETVPYVNPAGLEEILASLGKEAAGAKPTDFIDNSLVRELEQEGYFRADAKRAL
ncbi:MAG TPA: ABC transporter substrate-binding protein [Candidatus Binatia bacterium]|jgi:NitT/TauT family transport system substrate-binding protein